MGTVRGTQLCHVRSEVDGQKRDDPRSPLLADPDGPGIAIAFSPGWDRTLPVVAIFLYAGALRRAGTSACQFLHCL